MINIESKKECNGGLIFTTDDILLSESTRGKIFLSNESLFFNKGDEEKIISSMESLPPYQRDELRPTYMVGFIKEDDGDIIIIHGERVGDGKGSITSREGITKTGKNFSIEIFSEREADPNRGWFARGALIVTPNSFSLEAV